jgi:hypothetical protein
MIAHDIELTYDSDQHALVTIMDITMDANRYDEGAIMDTADAMAGVTMMWQMQWQMQQWMQQMQQQVQQWMQQI